MDIYFEILNTIIEEGIDTTKLYILSFLDLKDRELAIRQMDYIYDLWIEVDVDVDLDLSRLADIVVEFWGKIQNDEMTDEEIIEMCLSY